ncbi:MAG: OsmC family protein [Candidatus Thermoplasmatota archaeon]|nr:OsmC family protein [Candidatus Thermoplasmatota archaeon]
MVTGVPDMLLDFSDRHPLQESTAHRLSMQGRVEWTGGTTLDGINAAGQRISMDWESGPSPMQLTLQMVGACSLVDVVIGLKERAFTNAWVDLDSIRAETSPRRFTSVTMVYHVVGDVPQKLVERVVAKSHEKYCSVSASLDPNIKVDWRVEIHPDSEA